MQDLRGKVAAVTGAASGLGRAMALAFAREGMHVALADVDENSLAETERSARALGVRTLAMRVDVSKAVDVDNFAERTTTALGGVHVVCNNAGVSPVGAAWENSVADWEWTLGVNLWGVIHGIRAFVPRLIAQNEGHVINTASVAGLISPPGMGVYNVTKHAVVTLSETVHHDLQLRGAKVGISVLCPAFVPTGIADSERNRPAALANASSEKSEAQRAAEAMVKKAVASGKISAAQVADAVLDAIRRERFYILTHERIKPAIRARMEDVLDERTPRDPLAL
jgi:NAD(P)-dependent dehydrogenase (short-subunit alcohol dehydrogenase family)